MADWNMSVHDCLSSLFAKEPSEEREDFMCPICMQKVQPRDQASVPACGHEYCVYCIVRWAEEKDTANCPQCKKKFESVNVWRNLDGTERASMVEESVCLLKRTSWYLKRSKGLRFQPMKFEEGTGDDDWEEEDYLYNDIDDAEDYYFSNAAGSARIVLANRTFGKNGYIRSGRVYAQSVPNSKSDASAKKSPAIKEPNETTEKKKNNCKGKKAQKREKKKKAEANRIL